VRAILTAAGQIEAPVSREEVDALFDVIHAAASEQWDGGGSMSSRGCPAPRHVRFRVRRAAPRTRARSRNTARRLGIVAVANVFDRAA